MPEVGGWRLDSERYRVAGRSNGTCTLTPDFMAPGFPTFNDLMDLVTDILRFPLFVLHLLENTTIPLLLENYH